MTEQPYIAWFSSLSWVVLAALAAVIGVFLSFLVALIVRLPIVDGHWHNDKDDHWIECPNCHRENPANMHACLHCGLLLHRARPH